MKFYITWLGLDANCTFVSKKAIRITLSRKQHFVVEQMQMIKCYFENAKYNCLKNKDYIINNCWFLVLPILLGDTQYYLPFLLKSDYPILLCSGQFHLQYGFFHNFIAN